ncbi:MAG: hypothetical protein LBH98_07715 [Chitinispirillales bacterium]|jgi:predicted thioesterase|nr:hypothetical protein [Chitinispirillales bacterium]
MLNKNRFLKVVATIAIAAQMVSAATDITAKFTDQNFKAVVYETIGKTSPTAILDSDVNKIMGIIYNLHHPINSTLQAD